MQDREYSPKTDFSRTNLLNVASKVIAQNQRQINAGELTPMFSQGRWSKNAEVLRTYPVDLQKQIASGFFGPEGGNFPNGLELADFLVRINNIPWFSPKGPPDRNKLQESINQFGTDINLGSFHLELIIGDWEAINIKGINERLDERIDAMKVPVFSALREHGRWQAATVAMDAVEGCVNAAIHTGWQKTRDVSGKAWGAARSTAANASIYAKYAVSSIVAYDVIEPHMRETAAFQKSNPMDGLFKIFEMGAVPIGAHYGGNFIVFWPMN